MKRHAATPTTPAPKKTRFVDPADDPARFADDVHAALENTSHRRNRVRTEGYDSDSSDDREGVVPSRKHTTPDDIFALDDPDPTQNPPSNMNKKKHEYLRLGDIDGQVFNDPASDSRSSSDPEDDDDAAAERRKKAGMGYEISSFNMRDEMDEGKFTQDGNYVRTVDVHAVHDRWLDGFSERDITLARRRKRQHDKAQRDKIQAEERELEHSGGNPNLQKDLLAMLKKGETVLEALRRLGAQAKRAKATPDSAPTHIERITHLASNIMALGETDIYSKSYEELVRAVRSSGAVDDSWLPPSADIPYEYKWDVPAGPHTDQTFGPFTEHEMKAWMKASYFGVAGEKVKVRPVGHAEWGDWDDVFY